jgi:hypothetical protein
MFFMSIYIAKQTSLLASNNLIKPVYSPKVNRRAQKKDITLDTVISLEYQSALHH